MAGCLLMKWSNLNLSDFSEGMMRTGWTQTFVALAVLTLSSSALAQEGGNISLGVGTHAARTGGVVVGLGVLAGVVEVVFVAADFGAGEAFGEDEGFQRGLVHDLLRQLQALDAADHLAERVRDEHRADGREPEAGGKQGGVADHLGGDLAAEVVGAFGEQAHGVLDGGQLAAAQAVAEEERRVLRALHAVEVGAGVGATEQRALVPPDLHPQGPGLVVVAPGGLQQAGAQHALHARLEGVGRGVGGAGVRGQRAKDWRLVDDIAKPGQFAARVQQRALQLAERSDRPAAAQGVKLTPLQREVEADALRYHHVAVRIDRARRVATFTVKAPSGAQPADIAAIEAAGAAWYPLQMARELDDAILAMRSNELDIGTWLITTEGDAAAVLALDATLHAHREHWLVRETLGLLRRTFSRLDVCSRSLFALIEPGSCFAGTLLELALACDRSYMLTLPDEPARAPTIALSELNFGCEPAPATQLTFWKEQARA